MTRSPVRPARRRLRILVVDDEELVRTLVDRILREAGYETVIARSAEEALAVTAKQEPFDLLLTDLVMPEFH